MEGVDCRQWGPFGCDVHHLAFLWVEGHEPALLPVCKVVEVVGCQTISGHFGDSTKNVLEL